ncbi:uncharacterized protein At4g26485-like [Salvia miltiorrhiza]|uniref:uncharacterized protein At4g26485-like n=1 Tax=Salvia miltiorrhiza TaxID=226208 RepID=UPI0025AC6630|nr:uncharacterized protein At4g26485-like [Salvia miltiorrhiza]
MGILQSSCRAKEEEDEIPIYPDFQNHYISWSPKLLKLSILIYKALKGILRKIGSIFSDAEPLLPVPNPASRGISTEPLLLQTPPPISDDEDLECDEENYLLGSAEEETVVVEIKTSFIQERWIKHYSSGHRILLVGEGNFSFSACLALAFHSAPNIIATSLDSRAFLEKHYDKALSNIEELRSRGSKVMHKINATTMANHQLLAHLKFDRIIFNFPYVGLKGFKNLPRQSQLACQQKLVRQFLENAREMIKENGEIHITHKTNGFHGEWRVVSLGRGCGLRLMEATKFNYLDYPGYNTKCGFGGNGDFNCNPSKTYKFQR